jgi:serine/threonine protein kinase
MLPSASPAGPSPSGSSSATPFTKTTSSHAPDEANRLRLVEGPGVVPLLDADDHTLVLDAARCSIADVLADRGRLSAPEVRGVAVATAHALARCHDHGLVHGDVKPANLLLSVDGQLWLTDFDAAGPTGSLRRRGSPGRGATATLTPADDIRALAATAVECAIGHCVDLAAAWSALQLAELGCPADLAAELAMVLRRPTSATAFAELLDTGSTALPRASAPNQADRTPTVEFSLLDWT